MTIVTIYQAATEALKLVEKSSVYTAVGPQGQTGDRVGHPVTCPVSIVTWQTRASNPGLLPPILASFSDEPCGPIPWKTGKTSFLHA